MTLQEIKIELADLDAWDRFVSENKDGIEEAYGSVDNAYQHAIQGGLTLGGGAAPMFYIYFAE